MYMYVTVAPPPLTSPPLPIAPSQSLYIPTLLQLLPFPPLLPSPPPPNMKNKIPNIPMRLLWTVLCLVKCHTIKGGERCHGCGAFPSVRPSFSHNLVRHTFSMGQICKCKAPFRNFHIKGILIFLGQST